MQSPSVSIPVLKIYQTLAKEIGARLEVKSDMSNNKGGKSSRMVIELTLNDWVTGLCGIERSMSISDDILVSKETSALAAKLKVILNSNRNSGDSTISNDGNNDGSDVAYDIANLGMADMIGLESILCDYMIGKNNWTAVLAKAGVEDRPTNINFICHLFVKLFNHFFGHNLLVPLRLASLTNQDLAARLGDSFCSEDLDELSPTDVFAKETEMLVIRKLMADIDKQIGNFLEPNNGRLMDDKVNHDRINEALKTFLNCTTKSRLESLDSKFVLSTSTSTPASSNASTDGSEVVDPYAYWSKCIAPIVVGRELGALWTLRSHLEIYEFAVDNIDNKTDV
jgi:hypothetical protein